MISSETVANPDVICLSVTLDPANPSQARLLDVLHESGYYDPAARAAQPGCDELIRILLGQYLRVFPWWSDTGESRWPEPSARTRPIVHSGDRITPDWCPPTWGGRR